MSKRLSYERYVWFHQKLKTHKYPKLKDLMERYEISRRQAAREIENMRLYFNAPVEYSQEEKGYYYSDHSFEFPSAMISEEELISLIIAKRLSVTIPDSRRKSQLHAFFENLSASFDIDATGLEKKISLKNIRYYRVKPGVFDAVIHGLNRAQKLHITYYSVHKKEDSRRIIHPMHLILYMGNWHIFGYCELKKDIRDFALSRIEEVQVLDEPIDSHLKEIDIKEKIEHSYGIFFEGPETKVVLKFSSKVSDYVKEQVWFPGQRVMEDKENGGIILTFAVTDFREVAREILQFGADAEVLEPQELREIVIKKVKGLNQLYNK